MGSSSPSRSSSMGTAVVVVIVGLAFFLLDLVLVLGLGLLVVAAAKTRRGRGEAAAGNPLQLLLVIGGMVVEWSMEAVEWCGEGEMGIHVGALKRRCRLVNPKARPRMG